ncbi:MAG: hypothetical protein F4039_10630 [Gammaproteobacteria bacterium]|nr:hypothetical protein [Gammaproteobacteria bacterium]
MFSGQLVTLQLAFLPDELELGMLVSFPPICCARTVSVRTTRSLGVFAPWVTKAPVPQKTAIAMIASIDIIVDSVITYTLSIGAVRKPHLPGSESVHLFFEFTIRFSF